LFARLGGAAFLLFAIGWIALAVSAVALVAILLSWSGQFKLLRYPSTPGTMTRCEPLLTRTSSMPSSAGTPSFAPKWTVVARYTYRVNGVPFEGANLSNLSPRTIVSSGHQGDPPPESIAAICRKYGPSTPITVRYKPQDPCKSFVYFTSPIRDWPWLLVPVLAALVGWFFLWCLRLLK
jgi:hypothetical protein